jgi:cytochrome b pre-mRNA-processing protein 3
MNPIWSSRGDIGKEFRSNHTMILLHIWLVHKRLLKEGGKGKSIQEAMFDELWEDTCNRIRSVGVNELSVNKRLSEVQGYSFKFCCELDHAVTLDDEEEVLQEIAGSLYRNVYMRREVEEEKVLELAKYVRREHLSMLDISPDAIDEGRVEWGKNPDFLGALSQAPMVRQGMSNNAAGSEIDDELEEAIDDEGGEWKEAITPAGKIYYWNTKTRESRWQRP